MKQIKFRAYQDYQMYYMKTGYNNTEDISNFFKSLYYDAEIMQYTGIKDINGKEIYEDDIVNIQYPDGGDFENTNGRVFYWEEEGAFYHGNDVGRPPKRMWEYATVIGNIHENPNLWKQIIEGYKAS